MNKKLGNKIENIEGLIHAYLNGIISQEEKDKLFVWLTQNPANVTFFNQISDIWLSSSIFQDTSNFDENEAFNRVKAKINYVNNDLIKPKSGTIQLSWLKIAAIIIPTIILSGLATRLLLTNGKSGSDKPFLFEVPYGSKASIVLPDNSSVVLNAGSKLICESGFGKTHRMLNLIGEGYFKVAKNKKLPFVVHAGNLDVKALGTEFNVKAYPADKNIEAILIEGSIQIKKTISGRKSDPLVVLKPKQSLIYSKNKDRFQINIAVKKENPAQQIEAIVSNPTKVTIIKTNIDPFIYTTWKEGSWTIYQQELSALAVELERKYDVNISFSSEDLKKIKVTGNLPDISLEQVLSAIRLISPIEYKVNGKEVQLTENEKLMPLYKKYYRSSTN